MAILLSILVDYRRQFLFVSTSAIIIITHYLGHVSTRLVPTFAIIMITHYLGYVSVRLVTP